MVLYYIAFRFLLVSRMFLRVFIVYYNDLCIVLFT